MSPDRRDVTPPFAAPRGAGRQARRRLLVAVGALCLALSACSGTAEPPLVVRDVAATAPIDPAKPCSREAPEGPAAEPASTGRATARFDRATNTILLTGGEAVTLSALSRAVDDPAALKETAPGEWLLGATLEIGKGATVAVHAPEARWLKMSSGPRGFVSVRIVGGLDVVGTCITSWDTAANSVDSNIDDGRAFLLARDGGAMTIDRAEIRYLGHSKTESYGLAWRVEGTTGKVTNSLISNNYFGVYSFGVGGLVISDNEVYNSVLYGIDPHTGSHNLTIERNVVHDNGKHGIILAEDCKNSAIRDNIIYNNQHHGIVLYLDSDSNVVENNESFGNAAQGININEAAMNTVRGNRVYQNGESGIGIGQGSHDNLLDQNVVRANKQDGIRVFSEAATTTISKNIIGENARNGIYVDTSSPLALSGNTIFGSRVGVLLIGSATASPGDNRFYDIDQSDFKNG